MIHRPTSSPHHQQKQQAHQHRKIRPRIANRKPKPLPRPVKLRNFRGSNRSQNHNQKWNRRHSRQQPGNYHQSTNDLKHSHKVSRKSRMPKSNPLKPLHSHPRIQEFQNPLRKENQSYSHPYENNAPAIPLRLQNIAPIPHVSSPPHCHFQPVCVAPPFRVASCLSFAVIPIILIGMRDHIRFCSHPEPAPGGRGIQS